jgi:cytochrome d ubiquinol oxidase subunit I
MLDDPTPWHRFHFAFTIVYHYLFPQLTMGLAPLLVAWTWKAIAGHPGYAGLARFWTRIFGLTFAVGVVTGIPMEFQFGTNWSEFTRFSGHVIGQTLAMEGMFAFFLESAFIGALVWGEGRLSPRMRLVAAIGVAVGSWLSGYFILVTNAFMQHPVGHILGADGVLHLDDIPGYLFNPWALVMVAHTLSAALVTGAFVVAGIGAFYALRGVHREHARLCLSWGCGVGLVAALVTAFPSGDQQAKLVARYQPVALAAMEGRFESGAQAAITLIGQPNLRTERIDNAIQVPAALSFLATGSFHGEVPGLKAYARDVWPDRIELLYYAFHIMVGLGTCFILIMASAVVLAWRGRLMEHRPLLWILLLAMPFPYLANTAGWATAELGRQPWLIYGLFRTSQGASQTVQAGDVLFTLLGWIGLYLVLGVLYLLLIGREIAHGPGSAPAHPVSRPPSPQPPLEDAHG